MGDGHLQAPDRGGDDMTPVRFVITGDMETGVIQLQGPIDEPRIYEWLLGEALRVCQRRADARDQAAGNGKPRIVVARELP